MTALNDLPPSPRMDQPNNPLQGATLQHIVESLADFYGWGELGRMIPVRCFTHDPSVASSLKFLRKTPWARAKVEALYVETWKRARGL
jgi:uncharacterized protein (DUF2132 family)